MKRLIAILILAILVFINLDDRKTEHESLQEAITEFNLKESQREKVKIYPKESSYTEIDSLLTNGFSVKVKNYSNDDLSDMIKMGEDKEQKLVQFHRTFESEINIAFKNEAILNLKINARTFAQGGDTRFWEFATLQHTWLDEANSLGQSVTLKISVLNPITNANKLFEMQIDEFGSKSIKLLEHNNS